jgi:hypothetical protein
VWFLEQNKRIAPLPFLNGCRKRRLTRAWRRGAADPALDDGGADLTLRADFTAPPRLSALFRVAHQTKGYIPFGRRGVSFVTIMGNTELIQDAAIVLAI